MSVINPQNVLTILLKLKGRFSYRNAYIAGNCNTCIFFFFFLQSSALSTECKLYKLRIYSVHLNQFTDLSSVIYLVI